MGMLMTRRVRRFFLGTLTVLLMLARIVGEVNAGPGAQVNEAYVGSQRCSQCHQQEYQQWQKSHHAKAMMHPSVENVLGNFDTQEVQFNNIATRFSRSDGSYFITTQDESNKTQTYRVEYTFGYYPLQQYLIDIGDGKLQAFDIAWDSRPEADGGQRWFKLLPDEDTGPQSPFHWSRHLQNWNSRCAECHSTRLTKGYDPLYQRYETTFTEVNVACEACHGAGRQHVALVNRGRYQKGVNSGFDTDLKETVRFKFDESGAVAKSLGARSAAQINACGGCHSRRQVIGDIDPAQDYHDQYRLRFLDEPLYHVDGQIQDEVFVLGSFLQSKMHRAGVTCTHCHNAHTGEVKAKDNRLCSQCHKAERYDTSAHHHHQANSQGSLCINCHMPATTYMGVDARRDHAFSVPDPRHSSRLEAPSACNRCHGAESSEWASNAIRQWPMQPLDSYGAVNARARKADVLALREMVSFIEDESRSTIRQATLLSQAGNIPSRLTADTLVKLLGSESPMIRRAAAEASQFIPLQHRWSVLKALIADPSASVRYAVANQLAGYSQYAQGEDYEALGGLLREHEQQLLRSQDMPSGQTAIAAYALNQGNTDWALDALKDALDLEPDYLPALLNLADLYRGLGKDTEAKKLLERAVAVAPESGAAQHSLGLYWVRQRKVEKALEYLKAATEREDRSARYFYVYAIALESSGNIGAAIAALKQANKIWPNQYDLLLTLITYLEKSGQAEASWTYLSNLSKVAPRDPEVKRRLQAIKSDSQQR